MSLMEYCEIREGRLTPVYEGILGPRRCDWCEYPDEAVMDFGAMRVCLECFEEAEREWIRMGKA
jgi:hypothetical protein